MPTGFALAIAPPVGSDILERRVVQVARLPSVKLRRHPLERLAGVLHDACARPQWEPIEVTSCNRPTIVDSRVPLTEIGAHADRSA